MRRFFLLLLASMTVFACSKQDLSVSNKGNEEITRFRATVEGVHSSGTKIYSDEALKVLWNADDRITLFNKNTYNYEYKFTGADGANNGEFEKVPLPSGTIITANDLSYIYAVYPYVKRKNKIDNSGSKITVTLPETQEYKESSVGINANFMVAVSEDEYLQFKNVCGYLRFRLYGTNVSVSSIKLEGNNGEKLAGKADISVSLGKTPTTVMQSTATSSITMTCMNPVILGNSAEDATDFIFVIPPTTFSGGFKITITDNIGKSFVKSLSRRLIITRNKMETMRALQVSPL